jgi:diguanylate cyclase (GGDEF)-like protein
VLLSLMIIRRLTRITGSWARAEQDASWRATHDALTQLPNRNLLTDTISTWGTKAAAEGNKIALLYLDLDRFKTVNDMWGHEVGDALLCAVAGRIADAVREQDLVCRVNADEFIVAMAAPDADRAAESLAARLIAEFAVPFELPAGQILVTPSIGMAVADGPVNALDLVRDADTAMYQAKDSGRNTVAHYDSAVRDRIRRRVGIEQALRGALRRGEVSAHYQPIIDAPTDQLVGFEVLMRWTHPQLGSVSPIDFIPIAEETGLIIPAGAWILEQAARQFMQWHALRDPALPLLHVSVNVSVRQLRSNDLVDVVRGVIARTGIPVEALWLEVTESGAMDDPRIAMAILNELRDLGITICIDDFGTGYSSLSYLAQLPARIVKIDRSLIRDVGNGGVNERIVQSVIGMAHGLDREVVAEGVETVEQRDWLRESGCDLFQGYLYSRPLAAEAVDVAQITGAEGLRTRL